MGCSPEGCVSWWSDVLRSRSTTLQTSIDVGEGYVFSVNSLPVLEESCLVVTSLASLWVVSAPASVESSEVSNLVGIVQFDFAYHPDIIF